MPVSPNPARAASIRLEPLEPPAAGAALLENAFASIRLPPPAAAALAAAISESSRFFDLDMPSKARHSSDDQNFGFRCMGTEYSVSPARPDVNDCFTLWSDRLDLIPDATEIPRLTGALLALREELVPLVQATLAGVADSVGAGTGVVPPFAAASYLQVNRYRTAAGSREFLQERHEDGHMVTILHAPTPGLEIIVRGACLPVVTGDDEVIVMPGSTLTALTGGRVPPLEHQVRNLSLARRQSLMYFVNPELDEPLAAWGGNPDEDLREVVRRHPNNFGLADVPTL